MHSSPGLQAKHTAETQALAEATAKELADLEAVAKDSYWKVREGPQRVDGHRRHVFSVRSDAFALCADSATAAARRAPG